jgi:hypothetical protein
LSLPRKVPYAAENLTNRRDMHMGEDVLCELSTFRWRSRPE